MSNPEVQTSKAVSAPIWSLQILRACAALAVVAYHIDGGVNKYMPLPSAFHLFVWGKAAVPLFFVLSGFVVSLASQLRPRGALEFLYARLARLYPTYLFTAMLFISSLLILPESVFRNPLPVNLAGIIKTLCFEYGEPTGYVYVGWVLLYEACFYLLFSPFVSRFQNVSPTSWFYVLLSALLAATAFTGSSIISYFLTGIAAFLLCSKPGKSNFRSARNLVLFVAVVANGFSTPIALYCFLLVTCLYRLEVNTNLMMRLQKSFMKKALDILFVVGDASYSIYLAQVLTLSATLKISRLFVANLLPNLAGHNAYLFYWSISLVIGLFCTVFAGLLMRRWIETPSYLFLMQLLPHIKKPRQESSI